MLAGVLGNLGIQLLARAYAAAEAQALGVLEFTALPWAALFGWVCFGEAVRPQVWAGAAVIFGACWLVGRRSGRDGGSCRWCHEARANCYLSLNPTRRCRCERNLPVSRAAVLALRKAKPMV